MILFREKGPLMFRKAVEKALHDPSAIKKWYLSVIARMAQSMPVWTISANGLQWCEVDFPADLKQAKGRVVRSLSEGDQLGGYRHQITQGIVTIWELGFRIWDCRDRAKRIGHSAKR